MTMFYSDRDLRLLDEKRVREIVREVVDESKEQVHAGHIRTIDGCLVPIEAAMKGPTPA